MEDFVLHFFIYSLYFMSKNAKLSIGIILVLLVLDQILKIEIKTQPGSWLYSLPFIDYTENNGMAFGIELPGAYGKYFLTGFRLVASVLIAIFIGRLIKRKSPTGVIVGFSLILAGALGNIIDSVFYGVIFDYAPLFQGRVVDMFHFNFFHFFWPEWVPFIGGNYFEFFAPIFNLADSAITTGIFYMMIFQRKFFKENQF
jgi:signal peptidase II